MKNIQIKINTHNNQLDVQELATLTIDLWKITRPEINASIEGVGNWIKNLRYDEAPMLVKAYTEEKLVG